ncbi:Long-chain-fatty-acid--CoA ligase 5 (Arachidonate--CoA ligase) (Long-chain acyl-CoA synthetase 5) (LACS 5), partial [Durusdinium trenchii]
EAVEKEEVSEVVTESRAGSGRMAEKELAPLTPAAMERGASVLHDQGEFKDVQLGTSALAHTLQLAFLPLACLTGWVVLQPREHMISLHFGTLTGYYKSPGCQYVNPCGVELRRISTAQISSSLQTQKVADARSNPVNVSAIVTFRVVDAPKALLNVERAINYTETQAAAVMKEVVGHFTYEELKTETQSINDKMLTMLQPRVDIAGVQVQSVNLNELNYAVEIASAMLRKQQAGALVEARNLLVQGAVEISQDAVEQLEGNGIEMNDHEKARLISNLVLVTSGGEMGKQTAAMCSVEVPGSARPDLGLGAIRRSALQAGPELSVDGMRTIYELVENAATQYPRNECLGYRPIAEDGTALPFVWYTYEDVFNRAINFGAGLSHLSLCPPSDSDGLQGLGFFAKNRPEWIIGDMGCYSMGFVPVPMYDTLGVESVEYVVRQTEIKTMFCTSVEIDVVLPIAEKGLLTAAVLMDGEFLSDAVVAQIKERGAAAGLQVYTCREVEDAGKANPTPKNLPKGSDVAFFCYTSGTTGDPKGVLVKHEGLITCLQAMRVAGTDMQPTDVHLSYLPLPHVFERGILYSVLYGAGRVGFYQGDTLKILEDIQELRPTIFPSVPRLLNRVRDKILAGVEEAGGIKKWLFEKALASKVAGLQQGSITHPIWDRLVFNALKTRLGFDRIRLMCTGSAPISGETLSFLRAVFGTAVVEGFGQSEGSLSTSFTMLDDYTTGHVGVPSPCNEIRLEDVKEMDYLTTDTQHSDGTACLGRGEILYRGTNAFKGYYKMPEKTAETLDKDGWVHTGDIGLWTSDGKLRIIDRKKNIFKLAQGEYVAAEKIENVITRSSLIMQCFVHGDSLQNSLVCIVVPDAEALEARGLKVGDPKTADALMDEVRGECAKAELKGFEIPKAMHVSPEELNVLPGRDGFPEPFTVLTPTFKLVRSKARDYFAPEIEAMYARLNSTAKL